MDEFFFRILNAATGRFEALDGVLYFFAQRVRDYLGIDAYAPQEGDSAELEF